MILSCQCNCKPIHNPPQPQIQHICILWKFEEFSNFKQSHNSRIAQSIQNITGILHPTGCNSNNYFYRIMNGDLYAIETIISIFKQRPTNWPNGWLDMASNVYRKEPCSIHRSEIGFRCKKTIIIILVPFWPPNTQHFCLFACFGWKGWYVMLNEWECYVL